MNTAKKLLDEAAARGLTLLKNGEKIVYVGPPDAMTDDLADRLRAHRAELLRLLPDEKADTAQAPRQPDAAQEPAVELPPDMSAMLRRVAAAYEWTAQDREHFVRWAMQGIREARRFLQMESSKLATPGRVGRCSAVMGLLAADTSTNVAWTCFDPGDTDPWVAVAIRDHGAVEMSIPRGRYDPRALPKLVDRLVAAAQEAAR